MNPPSLQHVCSIVSYTPSLSTVEAVVLVVCPIQRAVAESGGQSSRSCSHGTLISFEDPDYFARTEDEIRIRVGKLVCTENCCQTVTGKPLND